MPNALDDDNSLALTISKGYSMTQTSDADYIRNHRQIWQAKPSLQRLYREQYYQRIFDNMSKGELNLEIGSGPGFLADISPNIIRTDILHSPYVQIQTDAHDLPFADNSIDNVIGLDVLHHFSKPIFVLEEVARVLRRGGRFVLVEPYITPFSKLIYTYFHQEECDLSARPWDADNQLFDDGKAAFDGNAAIPYLLVEKGIKQLGIGVPLLSLKKSEKFSLLTYLLSGGFKSFSLLPNSLYSLLYAIEEKSSFLWRDLAALRAVIVWEKF